MLPRIDSRSKQARWQVPGGCDIHSTLYAKILLDSHLSPNVLSPNGPTGMQVRTTMLDMNMGTEVVNLQPDGKGHFRGSGDLGMGGDWQVRIEIRTLDATLHEALVKFFTPF